MGSPVDDALDNLSRIVGEHKGPTTGGWYAISQVRSALKQLREERDATMRSYDSSLRTLAKAIATAEAAEAEVQRYREGLREIAEDKTPSFRTMLGWAERWERHEAHARALLADRPDGANTEGGEA